MCGKGHPIQSGHILTLGAGGNDDQLVLGNAFYGTQVYNGAGFDLQVAQLLGDLQHIFHAAAGNSHLTAVTLGGGNYALNPVHIGGKRGDDNTLIAVFKLTVQAFGNHIFAGGIAGPFHIGGVGQKCQHTLVSQFTQTGQIHHPIGRSGIDLKITGHNHRADRGFDGKSHGVGNGMIDMDKFYTEAAGLYHVTGLMGDKLYGIGKPVLLQLQLNQAVGHGSAVNGAIDLLHTIGDGTDMILMTVGNEHTAQFFLVGNQIGKVGDNQIHTIHIFFGEAYAAVNDNHILAVFQYGNILSDFVQSAQGNDFQFFSQFRNSSFRSLKQDVKRTQQAGSRCAESGPVSPFSSVSACIIYGAASISIFDACAPREPRVKERGEGRMLLISHGTPCAVSECLPGLPTRTIHGYYSTAPSKSIHKFS